MYQLGSEKMATKEDLHYDIRIPQSDPDFELLAKLACSKKFGTPL